MEGKGRQDAVLSTCDALDCRGRDGPKGQPVCLGKQFGVGGEGYFIQGVVVVVDYDSIMIMLHALATNVIAALSDFNCSQN